MLCLHHALGVAACAYTNWESRISGRSPLAILSRLRGVVCVPRRVDDVTLEAQQVPDADRALESDLVHLQRTML